MSLEQSIWVVSVDNRLNWTIDTGGQYPDTGGTSYIEAMRRALELAHGRGLDVTAWDRGATQTMLLLTPRRTQR